MNEKEFESLTDIELEQSQDWINIANNCMLFGHRVSNLDRQGLLAVIGCISMQYKQSIEDRNKILKLI